MGFNTAQSSTSTVYAGRFTLTSTKRANLSGNNSLYIITNLGLANQSFLNPNNEGGANVLAKLQ